MKPQDPRSGCPLTVHTIDYYKLLGNITPQGIRKKLKKPHNKFVKIRVGGTNKVPHYGYALSDIIRFWREVCNNSRAEEYVNDLIDAKS